MSQIVKLIKGGLPENFGWTEKIFTPQDIALIDAGMERMERGFGRPFSVSEKQIYYSALCSGLVLAGEIMRDQINAQREV